MRRIYIYICTCFHLDMQALYIFSYTRLFYIYIPKHVKLTVSTDKTWNSHEIGRPKWTDWCAWFFVKVPQSKTENPNAFCWFFLDPVPISGDPFAEIAVVFRFFWGGGHFSAKNCNHFQFHFPICPNSSVLENWILWAFECSFWQRLGPLVFFLSTRKNKAAKEHIQKGMRHSQLNSCDVILQQLGILRIVLEWLARSPEPSLGSTG